MRSFKDILTESKKTYSFIVRVAGDLPEGFVDHLKTNLQKFNLIKLGSEKRTPIQERPLDFPTLQNLEVHSFEAEVEYPTTAHVLKQYLVDNCVIPSSHMVVRVPGEPVELIQDQPEEQPYETLLTKEELGGESAQQAVASNRVMDLLKELEKARKERENDPVSEAPKGESKDMDTAEKAKSPIGS